MTRQEAIDKARVILGIDAEYTILHIKLLEALGLLKFDKEEYDLDMLNAINKARRSYSDIDFAHGLAKEGYKIVKSS